MVEAEKLFRAAIEKNPNFALAYVGLADRLATDKGNEAVSYVEKALELDPNLAEAYATQGFLNTFHSLAWDWRKPNRNLKNQSN